MKDVLKEYLNLCEEGEALYKRARQYFEGGITCRAGCGDCCVDIAVFPLEWEALRQWLDTRRREFRNRPLSPARCVFLEEDSCSVYPIRPLICRVHGVPLLYRTEEEDFSANADTEQPPYQVTWCEYNFREMTPELGAKVISDDTVIDMENLNERLTELHYRFLETETGSGYDIEERYTINRLYREWNENPAAVQRGQGVNKS